jgi:hypothetical protein
MGRKSMCNWTIRQTDTQTNKQPALEAKRALALGSWVGCILGAFFDCEGACGERTGQRTLLRWLVSYYTIWGGAGLGFGGGMESPSCFPIGFKFKWFSCSVEVQVGI